MKVLTKVLGVGLLVALISGCATNTAYVPKLPPHAQAMLLDYNKRPANKVFVIAVDPSGDFAVGYDYGKATKKEAYLSALAQCNANRKTYGVLDKPHIYAINNKVVYAEAIKKAKTGE